MDRFDIHLEMERMDCPTCGIIFYLPENFLVQKRKSHEKFLCANGHKMWYPVEHEPAALEHQLTKAQEENATLRRQVLSLTHQVEQMEGKYQGGKNESDDSARDVGKGD